jgi:hydrogenase-4 component B
MGLLGIGCVTLGLFPGLAGQLLVSVVGRPLALGTPIVLSTPAGTAAPLLVFVVVAACLIPAVLVMRVVGGPQRERRAPTWVCGFALKPQMSYGSMAFAKPIRLFFRAILRPERIVDSEHALAPFFPARLSTSGSIRPMFERHLYGPVAHSFIGVARTARVLQGGNLRLYLGYILATLVVLLLVIR